MAMSIGMPAFAEAEFENPANDDMVATSETLQQGDLDPDGCTGRGPFHLL